ncbi:unnamed protein product [Effrenium voratum]|uniref:CRAL-TRIO domain-containing protein n=1 Tax=Effrenium voratum TaxID=2562239 RepID=A0AA36IZ60_9DINO|nr:unnamed protein product [Effrenium voratum]
MDAASRVLKQLRAGSVNLADVRRYLRACNGDEAAAANALAATLRWRQKERPEKAKCQACSADPRSHNLRIVGVDKKGRPVIYTCFSQAINRSNPAHAMQHLTRTLEDATAMMSSMAARGAEVAENWILVIDFFGYSWLLDTDPRAALFAARLLAHYPERLSRCLLVDAPAVFSGTYSAVRRVLNEGTASKIVFVKSGDALAADVESWASEPLRHWLLAEMEENRQPWSQEGRKLYWQPAAGHDPRGCEDFLRSPEFGLTLTARLATPDAPKAAPDARPPQQAPGTALTASAKPKPASPRKVGERRWPASRGLALWAALPLMWWIPQLLWVLAAGLALHLLCRGEVGETPQKQPKKRRERRPSEREPPAAPPPAPPRVAPRVAQRVDHEHRRETRDRSSWLVWLPCCKLS